MRRRIWPSLRSCWLSTRWRFWFADSNAKQFPHELFKRRWNQLCWFQFGSLPVSPWALAAPCWGRRGPWHALSRWHNLIIIIIIVTFIIIIIKNCCLTFCTGGGSGDQALRRPGFRDAFKQPKARWEPDRYYQEVSRRRTKSSWHRARSRGWRSSWIQFLDCNHWIWLQECHLDIRENIRLQMCQKTNKSFYNFLTAIIGFGGRNSIWM